MGIRPSAPTNDGDGSMLGNDQLGAVYANIVLVAQHIDELLVVAENADTIINSVGIATAAADTAATEAEEASTAADEAAASAAAAEAAAVSAANSAAITLGSLKFQDVWDATNNIPAIAAAAEANKGHYYVVGTAGNTSLNGIVDWEIGDWAVSNGVSWIKVDNTDKVSSVAGKTGPVVLVKGDVGLGNVDNTSDADKPVSTAQQTALNAKANSSDLAADTGAAAIGYIEAGAGAIGLTLQALLRGMWTLAAGYGVDAAATPAQNTAGINAAIAAVGAAGGGTILLPRGTLTFTDSNPIAANWDNHAAIWVKHSNVHLVGHGRGATVLTIENAADCHVVKFGQREEATVVVTDCSLTNVEIDGNRANQVVPTDPNDHFHGVDIASNCERIRISDFYIHDCQYYGIGAQRQGHRYCTIENGFIENTGSDSIDWKNDNGLGRGNVIRNVTLTNPGLATGLTLALAALDLRSGVFFENVTIFTVSAEANLVGLRINTDTDIPEATVPSFPTTGRGLRIIGNDGASGYGMRIAVPGTKISDFNIKDFSQGARVSAQDVQLSNFHIESCLHGLVFTQGTAIEADTCQVTNGTIRNNTGTGVLLGSVDNVTLTNMNVHDNLVGYDVQAGCTGIKVIGGGCTGNTTQFNDPGDVALVRHVSGLKTESKVTGSVAIDSVGVKTAVIAHGLAFTPAIKDVVLTLGRDDNDTGWEAAHPPWVAGSDANNISVQLRVKTAGTATNTVNINATIATKNGD